MSARRPRRSSKYAAGRSPWWHGLATLGIRTGRPPVRTRGRDSANRHNASLIGLDVLRVPLRLERRSWAPLIVAGVAGALFLAVLRMDVIRMGFALAENFEEELRLAEVERRLTVRMRQLRDPATLSKRAHELGFRRAEHLIDLPDPDRHRGISEPPLKRPPQPVELAAALDPSAAGSRR